MGSSFIGRLPPPKVPAHIDRGIQSGRLNSCGPIACPHDVQDNRPEIVLRWTHFSVGCSPYRPLREGSASLRWTQAGCAVCERDYAITPAARALKSVIDAAFTCWRNHEHAALGSKHREEPPIKVRGT